MDALWRIRNESEVVEALGEIPTWANFFRKGLARSALVGWLGRTSQAMHWWFLGAFQTPIQYPT